MRTAAKSPASRAGSSRSGGTSPSWPKTWARHEPPSRFRPRPRSTTSNEVSGSARQLGGQGPAHVADRRERGRDQRHRRDHRAARAALLPHRPHRHRVLADRDRDAERGRELGARRPDRGVEARVLARRQPRRRHPVARQLDVAEAGDVGGGDVGDRLADGQTRRGRGVEQRDRRPLANRHGLAGVAVEARGRDRAVGDRDLVGADHRVAADQAADGAVADRHQEGLVGDGRQAQDPGRGLGQRHPGEVERAPRRRRGPGVALHPRRLAEDDVERDVDRAVAEVLVGHDQAAVVGGVAEHRPRRALAGAQPGEGVEPGRVEAEDVALLGLVAPDRERRHAGLVAGHPAQLERRAAARVVDQLGHRVGQAAGADVVDRPDRRGLAERDAAVDDLLAAALDLGVVALDRREVEVLVRGALPHRRRRAAAEADQHGGAAEHDQGRARRDLRLGDVRRADVADPAGQHDRLVVAADDVALGLGHGLLEGAEVAQDRGPAELVVEGGAADRALEHDVERRRDPRAAAPPGPPTARPRRAGAGSTW